MATKKDYFYNLIEICDTIYKEYKKIANDFPDKKKELDNIYNAINLIAEATRTIED